MGIENGKNEKVIRGNFDGLDEAMAGAAGEQEVQPETLVLPEEEINAALAQADRLIDLTRNRREQAGYSHTEAKEHSDNFAESRSEITKIKNRLKKLKEEKGTVEHIEEVKELRMSLAKHLQAFRKEFPVQKNQEEKASESIEDVQERQSETEKGSENSERLQLEVFTLSRQLSRLKDSVKEIKNIRLDKREHQTRRVITSSIPVIASELASFVGDPDSITEDKLKVVQKKIANFRRLLKEITPDQTSTEKSKPEQEEVGVAEAGEKNEKEKTDFEKYKEENGLSHSEDYQRYLEDKSRDAEGISSDKEEVEATEIPEGSFKAEEQDDTKTDPEEGPEGVSDDKDASDNSNNDDQKIRSKDGANETKTVEKNETKTEEVGAEMEPAVEKAFESRLELRNNWKQKKQVYEDAYAAHLEEQKNKNGLQKLGAKLQFWKKDEMPENVAELKAQYQDAKSAYAGALNTALRTRFVNKNERPVETGRVVQAGLANRFILKSAHDQLAIEKQFVPEGLAKKSFEQMQEVFKKHGKTIRTIGLVTTVGVGVATGGIAAGIFALGGRLASAKMAAAGAAGGALLGGSIGQRILEVNENRRDISLRNAKQEFSIFNMEALEKDYAKYYKEYETAKKNQKYWAAGGAVTGAVLGGASVGHIDEVVGIELPTTEAPVEKIVPENLNPAEGIDDFLQPPLQPGDPTAEMLSSVETEVTEESLTKGVEKLEKDITELESELYRSINEEISVPPEVVPHLEEGDPKDYQIADEELDAAATEIPEAVEYTFSGGKIDTVSEALFETWKADPSMLDSSMTNTEFINKMYGVINELNHDPVANQELLEAMGIVSGDIDKVQLGQTINLTPFYELMNK